MLSRYLRRRTRAVWAPFLRLFPERFRRDHGEELLELMRRRTALAADRSGLLGILRLWAEEFADLLVNAARQRMSLPKWRSTMLEGFAQDLKFAVRSLLKRPAFFFTAALMLSLGIGANSAVFSVVNAVLLKPLPYQDSQNLVMIWSRWKDFPKTWVSVSEYQYYHRNADAFQDIALFYSFASQAANLTGPEGPRRVEAATVTPNFFEVLRVEPARGRAFTAAEAKRREPVAMISHELWQSRYSGRGGIVGSKITADGKPFTVIGVTPAGFRIPTEFGKPEATGVFYAAYIDTEAQASVRPNGGSHSYYAVARLREGVAPRAADVELKGLSRRLTEQGIYPESWNFEPLVIPMREDVVGHVEPILLVLMGAVGFVLLIVCANVANLLLARAQSRGREIALRTALGAGRLRLFRQLLTESLLLALAGGVGGLAAAGLGLELLFAMRPDTLPRTELVGLDPAVVAFTLAACLATAVLFGIVPAAKTSRVNLSEALKEGERGSGLGLGQRRHQAALSAIQVALAVVLLVGAGLLLRTFANLISIDPGFEVEDRLSLRVNLPAESYPDGAAVASFYDRFLDEIRSLPGVESAAAARILPLATQIGDSGVEIKGYSSPTGEHPKGDWQIVSPGYFETMGIRLLRGRLFRPSDDAGAAHVAIINETMAKTYWPDSDPLGAEVIMGFGREVPWMRVVGIVEDIRHNGLTAPIKEKFYRPVSQFAAHAAGATRSMSIVVKAQRDPKSLVEPIRASLGKLDPQMPMAEVRTLEEILGDSLSRQRFAMLLLGLFAALGLVLAALGVYALIAYGVSRRRREIGIRMTLGARRRQVTAMVVSEGLRLAFAGIVVGLLGAALLTRLLESQLYGVQPRDLMTFLLAPSVFLAAALMGSLFPARKAAALDPTQVLREE